MPVTCCACSTFAKFWLIDGSHLKPVCTYHRIKYELEGYAIKTRPMSRFERNQS